MSAVPAGSSAFPVLPQGTVGVAAIPVSGHNYCRASCILEASGKDIYTGRRVGKTFFILETALKIQDFLFHDFVWLLRLGYRFLLSGILLLESRPFLTPYHKGWSPASDGPAGAGRVPGGHGRDAWAFTLPSLGKQGWFLAVAVRAGKHELWQQLDLAGRNPVRGQCSQ